MDLKSAANAQCTYTNGDYTLEYKLLNTNEVDFNLTHANMRTNRWTGVAFGDTMVGLDDIEINEK